MIDLMKRIARPLIGYLTRPDGLVWCDEYGWVTYETDLAGWHWTEVWSRDEWGRWIVSFLLGKESDQ
jgi:hypothetical protein